MIIAGLDTETTGLDYEKGHRIIEVAALLYDVDPVANTRKARGHFVQRINPMRNIDADAQRVHGISLDDLRDKPVWEDVAPKIGKIVNACDWLIIHNANFDAPFLAHELLRVGQSIKPDIEVFCTMENGRWATPTGKNPNLGELCYALNVDYDPSKAHSALYDVEVMMQAFFKGIDLGAFRLEKKV
ncbi:3'-5' exonuclease [Chitinibacter tainanensis]|uniref:3'-5' exonuclease n=1 Tax=Chitinibacter tainanensis TaxID=230667 RepID=UPI00041B3D40|nr:3'-5' exonuclease [Chitinibacter tainanensis]